MKLLLELGVDPRATSSNGMTALHVLASIGWEHWSTNITDAIQLLLDSDAHIDQPDDEGITALDLFKLKEKELTENGISNVYLQKLIHKVRPLTCLAAQVVSRHGIPFDDLPSSLISFVNRH
jgi:ankyrin repeat protein